MYIAGDIQSELDALHQDQYRSLLRACTRSSPLIRRPLSLREGSQRQSTCQSRLCFRLYLSNASTTNWAIDKSLSSSNRRPTICIAAGAPSCTSGSSAAVSNPSLCAGCPIARQLATWKRGPTYKAPYSSCPVPSGV